MANKSKNEDPIARWREAHTRWVAEWKTDTLRTAKGPQRFLGRLPDHHSEEFKEARVRMGSAAAALQVATKALIPLAHKHRIDAKPIHKLARALSGIVGFLEVTDYAGTTIRPETADVVADVQAIVDDLACRPASRSRKTVTATEERMAERRQWIRNILDRKGRPTSVSQLHDWLQKDGGRPIARSTLDTDLRELASDEQLHEKLPPIGRPKT